MGLELYDKTLLLPAKAFEEKKSGEIINRIVNDTSTVTDLLRGILKMSIRIVTCIVIYIYIITQSWIIALEIFLFIIFTLIISKIFLNLYSFF